MLSEEEIEKAKEECKNLVVNLPMFLLSGSEDIKALLQYIQELEQENKNLKMVLDSGLNKNKKYCFNEDGNTGKCLGYSNIYDDELCEYCKSCEAINVKGDD